MQAVVDTNPDDVQSCNQDKQCKHKERNSQSVAALPDKKGISGSHNACLDWEWTTPVGVSNLILRIGGGVPVAACQVDTSKPGTGIARVTIG